MFPVVQTLFEALPQMVSRFELDPGLNTRVHFSPFQRSVVPLLPTAHTSLAALAHTPSDGVPSRRLTARTAALDDELLAALERWEALGGA